MSAHRSRIPVSISRLRPKSNSERQLPIVTIDSDKQRRSTNLKGELFDKSLDYKITNDYLREAHEEFDRLKAEDMIRQQAASLVLQAFGTFVWSHISDIDQDELVEYGMKNFCDFIDTRMGPHCPAKEVAWRIYDKIDPDLKDLTLQIMILKRSRQCVQWDPLAHSTVLDAQIQKLLKGLGDGRPDLQPIEIAVLNHLKVTANTEQNIWEASHACD